MGRAGEWKGVGDTMNNADILLLDLYRAVRGFLYTMSTDYGKDELEDDVERLEWIIGKLDEELGGR